MTKTNKIKELFNYKDGHLFWRNSSKWSRAKAGEEAGFLGPDGYWYIEIKGQLYPRSHLVWYWHKGRWPGKAKGEEY